MELAELEHLESVSRLSRDLRVAAQEMGKGEVRYLVDGYYAIQKYRVGAAAQIRESEKNEEPVAVLSYLASQAQILENQIKGALDRWSRHVLRNVAPGTYRVTCAAEGFSDAHIDVDVVTDRRVEAACPTMQRMSRFPIYVVDGQDAPVAGALVLVDRLDPPVRAFTDGQGRVEIESRPGVWIDAEALHEDWGRGFLRLYAPYQPRSEPHRIRLEHSIGGEDPAVLLDELASWGIRAVADGRSIVIDVVDVGSPAAGIGLRRLDQLLWARAINEFRYSVGLRRDGELLTFDVVREPEVE